MFTGEHVKYTDLFKIFTAKEVQVKFSRPVALNVDGETFLDVTEYSVKSAALLKNNAECEMQSV